MSQEPKNRRWVVGVLAALVVVGIAGWDSGWAGDRQRSRIIINVDPEDGPWVQMEDAEDDESWTDEDEIRDRVREEHERVLEERDRVLEEVRERTRDARARARAEAPVPPVPPTPGSRARGRRGGVIDINVSGDDIVRVGRDVFIGAEETVNDVVVIRGDLDVEGVVQGDAVVVGGEMRLKDGAAVEGDAVVIGGELNAPIGALVDGQRVELPLSLAFTRTDVRVKRSTRGRMGDVAQAGAKLLVCLLLGWVVHRFFAAQLAVTNDAAQGDTWKAFFVGLVVVLLWIPVCVLACITIVGLIIGVPLLMLLPVALFVGFLVGCRWLGGRLTTHMEFRKKPGLAALWVGIVAFAALAAVAEALGRTFAPFSALGTVMEIAIALGVAVTTLIGIGALFVTRGGRQPAAAPPGILPDAAPAG